MKKTVFIQSALRSFLATRKARALLHEKLKHKSATTIQKYLRSFLANKEVDERVVFFLSLIKVQSFVRMICAKRLVRELREKRAR